MPRHFAAAVFFVVATIVMTWPLGRLLDRAVADPGDPFINTWILDWDYHATLRAPLSLFHANIFHPARYALAFSENLYGVALLVIPFRIAGMEPITTHNVAMLGGFAFSGFAAYLLALRLTHSYSGALAAGVFYAFVPFRFTHLSHLQHVWGGWMPLLLLGLLAYIDAPSWRNGALFSAVFVMNALTNIHWLLFGSFAIAISVALFYAAGIKRWRELIVCMVPALLIIAPFLYPYAAAASLYDMTRSPAEMTAFSAKLIDWFIANGMTRLHMPLTDPAVDPERRLFPGLLPIVLAFFALSSAPRNPRAVVLGVAWVVIGVAGSLGANFFFHDFLFDAVPGFQAIRVPARWAGVAHVGLAILVAVSTATIARRRGWAGALIVPLLLIELHAAPIRWYTAVPEAPPVYSWLEKQRVNAVLELPINYVASEYRYVLRATRHHKRILNGVSGFTPPFTAALTEASKSNPIPDTFTMELRKAGCDLIIVHADTLGEYATSTREWLRRELASGKLRFIARFDGGIAGDWVFLMSSGQRQAPNAALETFLNGGWTRNVDTFGLMDPVPKHVRGAAVFSAFALSPHGIRSVEFLLQNGAVRIPAVAIEDRRLVAAMPWYPAVPKPRFVAKVPKRPPGVRRLTDLQTEITDGRGRRLRLDHDWFEWQ